ncbi:MAG: helix-turn-helix domain-containing protein [Lachnospiraceae bacterium]|nr:helix-turn-helix domain-containing protein [Lachnospiraceae bacterium]
MKFGEKLRQLRAEKQASQAEVAEAAGVTKRSYVSYELEGKYPRKRETYKALARYFNVDVNYLLAEDEGFVMEADKQYGPKGKRQAEELVAELSGMFAGGELSEADKDAVMIALQKAYFDCKQDNKKYTPQKYRQDSTKS